MELEEFHQFRNYQTKRKSCVVSRSFGKRIEKFQELKEAVLNYCLNASEKLSSSVTKAITVFVRIVLSKRLYIFKHKDN